jgi:hypothetical protein
MLITFSSDAGPRVMMFADVGWQMLDLLGKQRTKEGIVIVEDLGDALQRLRAAVAGSREGDAADGDPDNADHDQPNDGRRSSVSFAQRAQPLIELLEKSRRAAKPVLWT